MAAYIVVDIEVTNTETYEAYKQLVPATVEKYGGRFIVRGGNAECLEGTWLPRRIVVLEFPSVEKAKAWYDSIEYARPKAMRQASAISNLILVEGV
jgi:uncharacterized protein (DUF1330 family)